MSKNIGFIGLGIMGKHMSSNLIKKGYNLIVYDKVEEAIKNLEKLGAKGAKSSKEVAKECDLVFMIVPDSSHSIDVIFGKDGLIDELKKGSAIVDMSSISPFYSKEIGKKCEDAGVNYVDAPVSGGEPKAITGELSFMVGAKESVFNDVKEYLECMGKNITLVGDIGSGTGTKLANQIIVNLNIAALSEAMIITKSLNIDPSKMLKAITGGLADSSVLQAKAPMMIEHNFKPGGRIDINKKDIKNVLETSHNLNISLPLTSLLYEIFQSLSKLNKEKEDHSAILNFYEHINNMDK
ncbi:NAD(P)-binding domain-containing protein [Brachyspira sp.]|uniref:NAD(P)-binding domain-containing protein n=1 Tax=Brachyspira sp. TaxID=1977261 RepID=UPI0026242183|nr:NAD(P)-binding domain-containing protein [Brachyspira sp.]